MMLGTLRNFNMTLVLPIAWMGLALHANFANAQQAQVFIVSDVDDTVKVSDVAHSPRALINALFRRKIFAGMSTLYREISQSNGNSMLYFVSGSPNIFKKPVESLVEENHFSSPWVVLHRSLSQSTPEFKVEKIREIFKTIPEDAKLLLIGDDGEKDPETYATVLKEFSSRVSAVYIHRVKARELPAGEIAYDTALDIAISEMEKGRMTAEQAMRIGNAVLSEGQDDETLVMPYNYCPTSVEDPGQNTEPYILSRRIRERIKQICIDRIEDQTRDKN